MARYDDDDDDRDDEEDFDDEDDETGVEVHTSFFPLAWILFLCTPHIEIDGRIHRKAWGTHFFPLEPGRYKIKIYFPYLFSPRCGENSIKIRVREGEVSRVDYFMPPWMFMSGTIREVD